MDDTFKKMLESFFSPEIQGCVSVVESIAGYKLSASDRQPFLYFHDYLTNPQPDFVTEWKNDEAGKRWYHKLANGILGDVQNAFACVLYRYERLVAIEQSVMEAIEEYSYQGVIGDSTIALGNTVVWDCEYQAFILAFRRCLDYLARAIAAYFRNDFHSFRKLDQFLERFDRRVVTEPLIDLHKEYSARFDFVLSEGNRKSVRDWISHYGYVSVGTINLSQRGFMLVGGGEELGPGGDKNAILLSDVLQSHVTDIRACIREFITSYVDGIQAEQNEKNV